MADGLETELKLVASPDMLRHLRGHPMLSGKDKALSLVSRYFDTKDGALDQAGATLRLRDGDKRGEQTFKNSSAGNGFSRGEWNARATGDTPDPAAFAARPRRLLEGLLDGKRLQPLSVTRVERTTRRIRFGDSTIEAAFDSGTIEAGRRSMALCELELELVDGKAADLFALAQHLPLGPKLGWSVESKGDRGRTLALKPPFEPVRATDVALSPDMTVGNGFQAIAWSCLTQLLGNYREVIASGHPDAVHQSRVAIRRLRAAFSLFGDSVADEESAVFRAEWKAAAAELGPARDLHVLIERVEAAAADDDTAGELLKHLRTRRTAAIRAAQTMLKGEAFQQLLVRFAHWLESAPARADGSLADFAAKILAHRRRKLVKGKPLDERSEEALHRLRIQGKKLRYAAEFFAALYPDEKNQKARRAFVKALGKLQDCLGSVHDLAVAHDQRETLFAKRDPITAAGLSAQLAEMLDAQGPRRKQLIRSAAEELERVAEAPAWWKHPADAETIPQPAAAD